MRISKFSIIIVGSVFLLAACGTSLQDTKVVQQTTVDCQTLGDIFLFLTPETSDVMQGKEVTALAQNLADYCKNNDVKPLDSCVGLSDSDEQRRCYYTYGHRAESIEECDGNDNCLIGFTATQIDNCDQYEGLVGKNGISFRSNCLFARAFVSRDGKYCREIEEKTFDECGDSRDQNLALCYMNQYKCLWGVSDHTDDTSLCEEMDASSEKDICLLSHALKSGSTKLCSEISTYKKYQTACFEMAADASKIPEEGVLNAIGSFY